MRNFKLKWDLEPSLRFEAEAEGTFVLIWRLVFGKVVVAEPGVDLRFSRRAFDLFLSTFFVDLFFRLTKMIFWAIAYLYKYPIRPNVLRRRQVFEKIGQKGVFRHFLKNFDQKIAFFYGRPPTKLSLCWRPGRLWKFFSVLHQK